MATVRSGQVPVLLVVDVQAGVVADAWQAPRVVGHVAQLVDRARRQGVAPIWVQHVSDELPQGSAAWQWAAPLAPTAGETLIAKQFNSAFEQTALEAELERLGASHIVLAGASTNWCIRATAYAALERGYDLTLVGDAHTTSDMDLGDGRSVQAEQVIADLNTAMQWLRYPGRRNAVAQTATLDFGTLPA